jgi:hypothetical protein
MRPRPSTLAELRHDTIAALAVIVTVALAAWLWVDAMQPLLR